MHLPKAILHALTAVMDFEPTSISNASITGTGTIKARGGNGGVIPSNQYDFFQTDDLGGWRVSAMFQVTDYLVTPGMSHDISMAKNPPPWVFYFDRKKSSTVAEWWNPRFPPAYNTFHKTAGELNFACVGDLTLTFTGLNMIGVPAPQRYIVRNAGIAQGYHHDPMIAKQHNNWWFACPQPIDGGHWWVTCLAEGIEGAAAEAAHVTFLSGEKDQPFLNIISPPFHG